MESKIMKFHELDGEQKLDAIGKIINMGYYENEYGEGAENKLKQELERDLDLDAVYLFEINSSDEVTVTAKAAY
jgi:hypothetical protein